MPSSTSTTLSPSWLDSVLGTSKQGVFSADFEGRNNTVLQVEDGDNIVLDCRVFLRREKTVRIAKAMSSLLQWNHTFITKWAWNYKQEIYYLNKSFKIPDLLAATHWGNINGSWVTRSTYRGKHHVLW